MGYKNLKFLYLEDCCFISSTTMSRSHKLMNKIRFKDYCLQFFAQEGKY